MFFPALFKCSLLCEMPQLELHGLYMCRMRTFLFGALLSLSSPPEFVCLEPHNPSEHSLIPIKMDYIGYQIPLFYNGT